MVKNNPSNGYSLFYVLLLLVMLSVVAFGAFRVFKQDDNNVASTTSNSTAATDNEKTSESTVENQPEPSTTDTQTSKNEFYSFTPPTNWKQADQYPQNTSTETPLSTCFVSPSAPESVLSDRCELITPNGFSVIQIKYATTDNATTSITDVQSYKGAKLSGEKTFNNGLAGYEFDINQTFGSQTLTGTIYRLPFVENASKSWVEVSLTTLNDSTDYSDVLSELLESINQF